MSKTETQIHGGAENSPDNESIQAKTLYLLEPKNTRVLLYKVPKGTEPTGFVCFKVAGRLNVKYLLILCPNEFRDCIIKTAGQRNLKKNRSLDSSELIRLSGLLSKAESAYQLCKALPGGVDSLQIGQISSLIKENEKLLIQKKKELKREKKLLQGKLKEFEKTRREYSMIISGIIDKEMSMMPYGAEEIYQEFRKKRKQKMYKG